MTGRWPSMTDYVDAVQDPGGAFGSSLLARAEFATVPPLGLPASASGQNAVVFMATVDDSDVAVRCFTTPCVGGERRYKALRTTLERHPIDTFARSVWVDAGICVEGSAWPIVALEWIDGDQLHDYVAEHLGASDALRALADEWVEVMGRLATAGIAHGDLQHGNILVEREGTIRLIDFDEVWLPELTDVPPDEHGHPNYQHPRRASSGTWGSSIDAFADLVVLLSLRALAADATLWEFHDGENLILRAEDFAAAAGGRETPVWERLTRSADPLVVQLTDMLRGACSQPPDTQLDMRSLAPTPTADRSAPRTRSSRPNPGSWWDDSRDTASTVQDPSGVDALLRSLEHEVRAVAAAPAPAAAAVGSAPGGQRPSESLTPTHLGGRSTSVVPDEPVGRNRSLEIVGYLVVLGAAVATALRFL